MINELKQWLEQNPMSKNFMLAELARQNGVGYNVTGENVEFSGSGSTELGRWLTGKTFNWYSWVEVKPAKKSKAHNVRSTEEAVEPAGLDSGPTGPVEG